MDPLTAVGPVASVLQLAQTALSLSKTLYSVGAAVASASENTQVLAQDLKTFSQSLTILSRLLEDSKSWYSDDIYLLTARVIKDCAELYVKIDKILFKLGSNGKSTWKLRVKFVYKEGQIKKLMKQLQNMKGTLATILTSLQVDLQLSLLNISSSSKIQRPPEKPLQPETIQTLREAQKAVEGDFLPKYSENLDDQGTLQPISKTSPGQHQNVEANDGAYSNVLSIAQSFVILPSTNQMAHNQAPEKNATDAYLDTATKSVKSSSSTESFKSAISMPQTDIDVARQVKAIRAVIHAFQTALHVLENLIERRLPHREGEIYVTARALQNSLLDRRRELDDRHIANFKECGQLYIEKFNPKISATLQEFSSTIMREVVMKLHEFSAEHEDLSRSKFEDLLECSENYSRQVFAYLNQLAPSQEELLERQVLMEVSTGLKDSPIPPPRTQGKVQACNPNAGEKLEIPVKCRSTSLDEAGRIQEPVPMPAPGQDALELSLPFTRYSFKRFDAYVVEKDTAVPPGPIQSYPVPAPPTHYSPKYIELDNPVPEGDQKQLPISNQNTPKPDGEQTTLDGDLTSKLDVLQDFDFDSFLAPDEESSHFELHAYEAAHPSMRPYTAVHRGSCWSESARQDIESRVLGSGKACDACIAHKARCDVTRPTCINCRGNDIECQYDGQAHAEEQNNLDAVEEESPIFVNAKQFHRILRRRAARQALKENSATRNHRKVSSGPLNEPALNNETIIPASQSSYPTAMANSISQAHNQRDRAILPPQITAFNASPELDHTSVDISDSSRLSDEKRARGARASARFRARKAKGREAKGREAIEQGETEKQTKSEEITKVPANQSAAPHRSVHGCPQNIAWELCSTFYHISSRSGSMPSIKPICLSPSQEAKLWWRSLASLVISNFAAFDALYMGFQNEFCTFNNNGMDDESLCMRVSNYIKHFDEQKLSCRSQVEGLDELLEIKSNILRIVSTINEQMGLDIAIFGWSCVCTVLRIYDRILVANSITPEQIDITKNSLAHLLELVAIMARYAVMENLYHQSGSAFSLKPEYQSSLISLCSTILEYFSASILLGRIIYPFNWLCSTPAELQGRVEVCEVLMKTIREKDQACQRFQVVVEAKEESRAESETEIDAFSDESWEEIHAPSSEDDTEDHLIDLDFALV
ncbi:hypothetical protein V8E51_000391 [Hyaloscypha variabilis]